MVCGTKGTLQTRCGCVQKRGTAFTEASGKAAHQVAFFIFHRIGFRSWSLAAPFASLLDDDLDAPVLRLADVVAGLHQQASLAHADDQDRLGRHAVPHQGVLDRVGTTQRLGIDAKGLWTSAVLFADRPSVTMKTNRSRPLTSSVNGRHCWCWPRISGPNSIRPGCAVRADSFA
jgi:hypothetical protein